VFASPPLLLRTAAYGVLALGMMFGLAACGRGIGDECSVNVDCATDGTRQCIDAIDGARGYCTVEGCDATNCPDETLCVRFFSVEFATRSCSPDPAVPGGQSSCGATELCSSEGFCVARASERRFCMQPCATSGDCREGLACRSTGVGGAELIPTEANPMPRNASFCFFGG
jgi:hypothetical protein